MIKPLVTVSMMMEYVRGEYGLPTTLDLLRANSQAIPIIVAKLCAHFDNDVNVFTARVVAHVFLYGPEAPRRIIKMAIDEMNRMVDAALASPDGGEILLKIQTALQALDSLMDSPQFGG